MFVMERGVIWASLGSMKTVRIDKAKENLINEIRKHVLPDLGDEGQKKVESIIEKIKDGSFDEEIYKEGIAEKPELKSKVKPTNFTHLIKNKDLQDLYYIARARDYQIRNATSEIPEYYIEYGAKYMFRFKYETRNELTDITAINWLDDTLYNLQDSLEEILYKYPKCENLDSDESGSLYKKAFESHVDAYLKAGFCDLNLIEWFYVVKTPDGRDIARGWFQGLSVLASCHLGIDPTAAFVTRPLSRELRPVSRELESIYKNFLQNSILQQLKR